MRPEPLRKSQKFRSLDALNENVNPDIGCASFFGVFPLQQILRVAQQPQTMGLYIYSEDGEKSVFNGACSAFFRLRERVRFTVEENIHAFDKIFKEEHDACDDSTKDIVMKKVKEWTLALRSFLDHSDCDGQWTPEECRIIHDLLVLVKPKMNFSKTQSPSHNASSADTTDPKPSSTEGGDAQDKNLDQLFAFFQVLESMMPTDEQRLDIMIDGLKYCAEHKQKAIFA